MRNASEPVVLTVRRATGSVCLTVRCDLDMATFHGVRNALLSVVAPEGDVVRPDDASAERVVVLDLVGVHFIDSVGVGMLVSVLRSARSAGVRIETVVTGQPEKVLRLAGLHGALRVRSTS